MALASPLFFPSLFRSCPSCLSPCLSRRFLHNLRPIGSPILKPTTSEFSFNLFQNRKFVQNFNEEKQLPDPTAVAEEIKTTSWKDLKPPPEFKAPILVSEEKTVDVEFEDKEQIWRDFKPWYDVWDPIPSPLKDVELSDEDLKPQKFPNLVYKSPLWPPPPEVFDALEREPKALYLVPPDSHPINVTRRIGLGSDRVLHRLRKDGWVPAVLYRKKGCPVHLKIPFPEAESAVNLDNGFATTRYRLILDGKVHIAYGQRFWWNPHIGITAPIYLQFMDYLPTQLPDPKMINYVPKNPFNSMRRKIKGKGKRKQVITLKEPGLFQHIWGRGALHCKPDWTLESPQYEIDVEDEFYKKHPPPPGYKYVRSLQYWYFKDTLDRVSDVVYDYKGDHAQDDPWTEEDEKLNQLSIRSSLRNKRYRHRNVQAKNLRQIVDSLAK